MTIEQDCQKVFNKLTKTDVTFISAAKKHFAPGKAQRNAGRIRNLGHINMEGLFTYLLTRVFPSRIFVPLIRKLGKLVPKGG